VCNCKTAGIEPAKGAVTMTPRNTATPLPIEASLFEEIAKKIKTEADLNALTRQLIKITVEKALEAELSEHLGYSKHASEGRNSGNSRNGYGSKTIKSDLGTMEIQTSRDRNATFEPQLISKRQGRLNKFSDQILALFARGMTTRDIQEVFAEMYGADISHSLVSRVTECVQAEVEAFQKQPLDSVYPIIFLDAIVVSVRQGNQVVKMAIHIAIGINMEGKKEFLGLWIEKNEGAKFWMQVLSELKNRGLQDIFVACVDGLTGFPEAIRAIYPEAQIQLCLVHMVRNSLKYVSFKDRKELVQDLKAIYQAASLKQAEEALLAFRKKWDKKYPTIGRSWEAHWENLIPFFQFPPEIRKVIYTTNAIESLNSVIRKNTRNRKIFPNEDSALKMVYLAIQKASQKWTMPIKTWKPALNCFAILFKDRFPLNS
jgi:putative transposase